MKRKLFTMSNVPGISPGLIHLPKACRAGIALALLFIAINGSSEVALAQTCIYTTSPPPGFTYPLFNWRQVNKGRLPQAFVYTMWEDAIKMTIEDGRAMGVTPNEIRVVLNTGPMINGGKEIAAWNPRMGRTSTISTQTASQGPVMMTITPENCFAGAQTIVFRKAKIFGNMTDVYHLDPTNFWRLLAGKVVTFTWLVDKSISYPYPMQCTAPCIPIGTIVGTSDIALAGPANWDKLPIAASDGRGGFQISNQHMGYFSTWLSDSNATKLIADFNGDGRHDIALTGGPNWTGIPNLRSLSDGTFSLDFGSSSDFGNWAASPQAVKLAGDFNGDGKADIALTGHPGWATIPIAFSNGNGLFRITNIQSGLVDLFASHASTPGAVKLTGDFNGDGKTDIALTGPGNWTHNVWFAYSNGDGSFLVENAGILNFGGWAAHPQATKLTGDFNGDGKTDIALTGVPGWYTLPIALSTGTRSFAPLNEWVGEFASWASDPLATKLTGDFNGDGLTDIALLGNPTWYTVPIAFSNGNGTFTISNRAITNFAGWASDPLATKLTGDFNGDGKTDIALTGPSSWSTIPVALSKGDGTFEVVNSSVGSFATLASDPQAVKMVGNFK